MFCPKCGKEVENDDLFCWNCGAKMKKTVAAVPSDQSEIEDEIHRALEEQVTDEFEDLQTAEDLSLSNNMNDTYNYRNLPTVKKTGIRGIYFFDFVVRLAGSANIPLCIYLVLNVIIIGLIATAFLALPVGWGMLCGLLVYIGSIAIAISPIGEAMIRHQNNCKKIKDQVTINRLEPLFHEVYYKAKKDNPEISSDIRLFINDEESANAFATGRKTICVTRGLLMYSDEEIKSVLAHEFGHLAHQDTDRILVVAIGNTAITAICVLFQIGAIMFDIMMRIFAIFMNSDEGFFCAIMGMISRFFTIVLIGAFMKVWTKLGVLLCMKTSRSNEYQADEFAYDLGYGAGLVRFLGGLRSAKPKGLFASLASSHPDNSDRIARIQALAQVDAQA